MSKILFNRATAPAIALIVSFLLPPNALAGTITFYDQDDIASAAPTGTFAGGAPTVVCGSSSTAGAGTYCSVTVQYPTTAAQSSVPVNIYRLISFSPLTITLEDTLQESFSFAAGIQYITATFTTDGDSTTVFTPLPTGNSPFILSPPELLQPNVASMQFIDPNTTAVLETDFIAVFAPDFDSSVPEPASLALLGSALVGLGLIRHRNGQN